MKKEEFCLSKLIFIPSKLRQGMDCEVIEISNIKKFIRMIKQKAKLKYGLKGFLENLDDIAGDKLI